jgi:stalled ribosome rescue protein Dom34
MKSKVVYITSDTAEIFNLTAEGSQSTIMKRHGPRHPSEPDGKHQLKKNDDVEHFMHEVATALGKEDARVLLVGPAQAKTRLKTHIENEHSHLAKQIVGVKTMDRATGPQIVAFAREYFTQLGVFAAI